MPRTLEKTRPNLFNFLKAADILQNGVMWLNADGHILGMNERFIEELGYSKSDLNLKTIFEVNPTTSFLSWKKLWEELLQDREFTINTEQMTADNSIYPVKMRGTLLEIDGHQVCMATVENLMETNRFRDLLNLTANIAGIGSWEWDLVQGDILFSDELFRLLQLPLDTPLSRSIILPLMTQLMSPKTWTLFKRNLSTAMKEGKAFEMELNLNISGNYTQFNLITRPVRLEGQTIKIYGTLQNLVKISQRTDELYFTKFCMDNARDMVFWLNEEGQITYANQTACDKLGYSAAELLDKTIKDIAPYSDVDLKQHWEKLKQEGSQEFESIHLTKSGQEIPVSIVANYFNYQGKEFNCGFVRDLSSKNKRDELIAMAKHSLDQSIDIIFWLSPDATFRYFNDAFVTKTGYTRKEIEKMTIIDFFPETQLADFKAAWKKMQQGAVLQSVDRPMRIKNNVIIPTEMTVNLVKVGKKEYSSTILRDISARKQKEEEALSYLRQIEELQKNTEAKNIALLEEIKTEFNFDNIISRDPNYKKVLRQVEQVADTDATVLILGETGTGKELLARAIHQLSEREDQPLIKINCGALPENLIESELFGHEKGSFTGAHQRKIGKFERANKGTIFLDEIGELPLDLQTKLLRVLQEGEIERVGGSELLQLDVRVIAATNRNLEELVAEKKFREDLYYRLNVFPIYNIPLRERREDIPALINFFAEKYAKKMNKEIKEISANGLNKLMTYNFSGNVRELENLVERAVILSKGNVLNFDSLISSGKSAPDSAKFKTLEQMHKDHIIQALKLTRGKVSGKGGAAELLGINDKTLTSRMKKLGVDKRTYFK